MSERESFCSALIVVAVGICVHILIPFQVSTEPIPGSRGFVTVSPSTLPRVASWGLVIVGLMWAARSFLRVRKLAGSASPVPGPLALPADELAALENERWKWSLVVWVGTVVYVILVPAVGYAEASILFGFALALSILWARPEGLRGRILPGLAIGLVVWPLLLYVLFRHFFYVTLKPGLLSALLHLE